MKRRHSRSYLVKVSSWGVILEFRVKPEGIFMRVILEFFSKMEKRKKRGERERGQGSAFYDEDHLGGVVDRAHALFPTKQSPLLASTPDYPTIINHNLIFVKKKSGDTWRKMRETLNL